MILDRRTLTLGLLAAAAVPTLARAKATSPYPDMAQWHIDTPPEREGMAPGPNGAVYYRVYGKPGGTPVVVLHGGPAAGEIYMRPYAGLATDRQVVLYDQTGCGRSARPDDLTKYTPDSYVSELEMLRDHLGFPQIAVLGHSWGGFLGPLYATAYPKRVKALVLAGSATSTQDFTEAARRWMTAFGTAAVATVARHSADPTRSDPAYDALMMAYYQRHMLRIDPWPAFFNEGGEALASNPVYIHLNGPSEIDFTGTLKDLDISRSLASIPVPTLVTCGEFDEVPAWVGTKIVTLMPNARLSVFKNASHMAHIEHPGEVIGTTSRFLRAV